MHNLLPLKGLYLLQSDFWKDDDAEALVPVAIGIGVVILLHIIILIIRRYRRNNHLEGRKGFVKRRYSTVSLQKIALNYKLTHEQRKLLGFVFTKGGVKNIERSVKSPAELDRLFKNAILVLEKNSEEDEDVKDKITELYKVRNILGSEPVKSTVRSNGLEHDTTALISVDNSTYGMNIINASKTGLTIKNPSTRLGTLIRLQKGKEVMLTFYPNTQKAFNIDAKVTAVLLTAKNPSLELTFTSKRKPQIQRSFTRKEMDIFCNIYLVKEESKSRKNKKNKKLVVGSQGLKAVMLDISVGGCAIKTKAPLKTNSMLKIEISLDGRTTFAVLGQVLRINRSTRTGTVVHVKFLKVPAGAFNEINSLVLGLL